MIGFSIFCIQIFFIQYAYSQTVATPAAINNPLRETGFGPNIPSIAAQTIAGPNIGLAGPNIGLAGPNIGLAGPNMGLAGPNVGLAGPNMGLAGPNIGLAGPNMGLAGPGLPAPMLAGAMPAFGPMAQGFTNQPLGLMGIPAGINSGYAAAYGGSGTGDVAVAGELPVVGTTAITGQVPMTGKVQFTGNIPAGGIVTISGQCGCGCSGPYNAPYAAKPGYNKPYLY